jgi:hypothetical protein
MSKFTQLIRQKLGLNSDTTRPGVQDAIELVLDSSSPKIRLVNGFNKKLRQPVEAAMIFIENLVDAIPGPLEVTSDTAVNRVLAQTFFTNMDQLKRTLKSGPELKDFLSQGAIDEFFVLLAMDREVKTIFGSRLEGEILLKDVAIKSVNFSEHTFRGPSATMLDLKQSLENGILRMLAQWSLEKIIEEQSRKEELSQLRDEMRIKRKMLADERQQMILGPRAELGGQSSSEAQKLLEQIEDELNTINKKSLDMDYYLGEVIHILNNPNDLLDSEHIDMHRDRIGILIDGTSNEKKNAISVLEIRMGESFHRSCVLLKCSRKVLMNLS